MTTLLSQQQTDALRSIGDGALVLFAISMVDSNYPGRITKPSELLPYLYPTYKDTRKLTTQLNALSASGRLAQNGSGYVLLEGGRALLLEMSGNALPETSSESLAQSPALAAGTVIEAQVEDLEDLGSIKGEISARALRAHEMTLKKEEEEELILKDTDSSTSKTAQNARNSQTPAPDADTLAVEIAPGVTTARILIATSMLEDFGDDGVFLHGLDIDNIHPREALAWIAQAYTQRAKIRSPAGLVYSRLKDADQPKARSKYREGWESYLPEDFLREIGWLKLQCDVCHAEFSKLEDLKAHESMMMVCEFGCGVRVHTTEELDAHHKTHEPKVPAYLPLSPDHRGAKVWGLVMGDLSKDMPRASFETWVRDTTPTAFEGNVLTVVVRNAYACDWLDSRLGANINAMLKNYLHEPVTVSFVVGKIDEE